MTIEVAMGANGESLEVGDIVAEAEVAAGLRRRLVGEVVMVVGTSVKIRQCSTGFKCFIKHPDTFVKLELDGDFL